MEVESTNINSLWLQNIYENLKNLEVEFRYAFEGCKDVLEYCNIPVHNRRQIIADVQYKNLRMIVTELRLLIKDIAPVIPDDYEMFLTKLQPIIEVINTRSLFVTEKVSEVKRTIISSEVTPFYNKTVEYLNALNMDLVLKIKHLLYISDEPTKKKPWTK